MSTLKKMKRKDILVKTVELICISEVGKAGIKKEPVPSLISKWVPQVILLDCCEIQLFISVRASVSINSHYVND